MSLHNFDQHLVGLYKTNSRECEAYEPSVVSSVASSQTSVFSETASEQSSIASSVCDDFRIPRDDARDRACAQAQLQCLASQASCHAVSDFVKAERASMGACSSLSYADATSAPNHQHPRRSSLARNQKPPTLQRQQERKTHFVDSLVDSASQMVEVIWPLSVVPCSGEASGGRGVLPLRTYIEETLRRSRTSYSTLQVALYYLVLIKAYVPKNDSTKEQHMDCLPNRALMCGRRMFLAALILASKYLQDRNYSAKAWSKMSGLSVPEINTNERTFLAKVDFRLHIPDPLFNRWTEIVLKYTPNTQPPPPGQSFSKPNCWRSIIPLLTPELDTVSLPWSRSKPSEVMPMANRPCHSPATSTPTKTPTSFLATQSTSHESTPTPKTALPLPRFLEPRPQLNPPTPALVRLGPLPTPQLTPSTVASNTPAVSACGSRRPSMCAAMAVAQATSFSRCTIDTYPKESCAASRRPSLTSATSSRSSPESMISDLSRTSRASSISSVSTMASHASLAHGRAGLARQATCRNARLPMPPAPVMEERETASALPIRIVADSDMTSSPEMTDFSISEKRLSMPHKHTKYASQPVAVPSADRGRKRCRPRGGGARRSDLHEEVRMMLEDQLELGGVMDVDREVDDDDDDDECEYDALASPSPAVGYATRMLSANPTATKMYTKCVQPPATLSRRGSCRMPVQRSDGSNKRSCCSTTMTRSPATQAPYAEVA